MYLRVISAIVCLWVSQVGASEGPSQVLAATPKCALINSPLTYALITGDLEVKQGELVTGEFRYHDYVTLLWLDGRLAGSNVFVEETANTVAGLDAALARIRDKC